MILSVLLYFFVAITAIQILYYLFFYSFLFHAKKDKNKTVETPVSIVVCAKNEAENLQEFLPSILNQKYSDFEVVLVNDASSDDTLEIMESFAKLHTNIKIVNVENVEVFWGNKKYALTLGIKKASHKNLLFITPNVAELSENWITETSGLFSEENEIIVGYNNFQKSGGLASRLMRYSRLQSCIQN